MTAAGALAIDGSRLKPTRTRVIGVCAILLAMAVGVVAFQFSLARDFILPSGSIIGGDYVAFKAAAHAAAEGDAAAAYDPGAFREMMREWGPPKDDYGLTWQYPPTYFLILFALSAFGYLEGYAFWTGATAALYFAALRGAGYSGVFLFAVLAAPSTFQAAITGQNGFLTAALLFVAALFPDKRPILAGIAAALLTVKPQLGLLIPVAYLAAGCWRAFFTASLGAVALLGASIFAFGVDAWAAFVESVIGVSDSLAAGYMPLYKMVTPFATIRFAGLPTEFAVGVQIFASLGAAAAIAVIWKKIKGAELRAAALCAGALIAAPYGFYYELTILALPVAILVKRGIEKGWLAYEQALLVAAYFLPLMVPGDAKRFGFGIGVYAVLLVAFCVLRRLRHEHADLFRLNAA